LLATKPLFKAASKSSAQVAPPKNQGSNDLRQTKDRFIFLDPSKYAAEVGDQLS
jgi:hypothetical protein